MISFSWRNMFRHALWQNAYLIRWLNTKRNIALKAYKLCSMLQLHEIQELHSSNWLWGISLILTFCIWFTIALLFTHTTIHAYIHFLVMYYSVLCWSVCICNFWWCPGAWDASPCSWTHRCSLSQALFIRPGGSSYQTRAWYGGLHVWFIPTPPQSWPVPSHNSGSQQRHHQLQRQPHGRRGTGGLRQPHQAGGHVHGQHPISRGQQWPPAVLRLPHPIQQQRQQQYGWTWKWLLALWANFDEPKLDD